MGGNQNIGGHVPSVIAAQDKNEEAFKMAMNFNKTFLITIDDNENKNLKIT